LTQRLDALDGIRGVAALVVVLYHIETTSFHTGWFRHGYLSVDLFFVLSGFVMARAYEPRFTNGMTFWQFARQRMIRLYPLIALGAVLGLAAASILKVPDLVAVAFLMQLFFIPFLWGEKDLFILNGVQWSLVFELLANFLHVALFRWLTTPRLIWLVSASCIALAITARHFFSVGIGWEPHNAWGAVPRVLFSYGAGLLLFRLYQRGSLPVASAPWWLLASAPLVIILAVGPFYWKGDMIAVLSFPILVWLSIFVELPESIAQIASFAGEISYPVYAIHEPLMRIAQSAIGNQPVSLRIVCWAAFVVALCLVAWLTSKFYDEPIRALLSKRNQPLLA